MSKLQGKKNSLRNYSPALLLIYQVLGVYNNSITTNLLGCDQNLQPRHPVNRSALLLCFMVDFCKPQVYLHIKRRKSWRNSLLNLGSLEFRDQQAQAYSWRMNGINNGGLQGTANCLFCWLRYSTKNTILFRMIQLKRFI